MGFVRVEGNTPNGNRVIMKPPVEVAPMPHLAESAVDPNLPGNAFARFEGNEFTSWSIIHRVDHKQVEIAPMPRLIEFK